MRSCRTYIINCRSPWLSISRRPLAYLGAWLGLYWGVGVWGSLVQGVGIYAMSRLQVMKAIAQTSV